MSDRHRRYALTACGPVVLRADPNADVEAAYEKWQHNELINKTLRLDNKKQQFSAIVDFHNATIRFLNKRKPRWVRLKALPKCCQNVVAVR